LATPHFEKRFRKNEVEGGVDGPFGHLLPPLIQCKGDYVWHFSEVGSF
jgi:hypothetical protein